MSVVSFNPCLDCGACCAFYRASFYWTEAEPSLGGTVPPHLTEKLNERMAMMKGTWGAKPRCIALEGEIGQRVQCSIYADRSSGCREFPYAWENNEPHERCDKARAAWGLPPLQPSQPLIPDQPTTPKVA